MKFVVSDIANIIIADFISFAVRNVSHVRCCHYLNKVAVQVFAARLPAPKECFHLSFHLWVCLNIKHLFTGFEVS